MMYFGDWATPKDASAGHFFSHLSSANMASQPEPSLTEDAAGQDPFALFARWWAAALDTEDDDASAMALATATASGEPSVRMVLLKGADPRGFSFFTNYRSRKADELTANPR